MKRYLHLLVSFVLFTASTKAQIITTIAGSPPPGYSGDGGPATAAKFRGPIGIAVDRTGNVYVCDADNSCIRKIDTAGIITTIAGTGAFGYSGDGGPATNAKLNYPWAIAVDVIGNLYVGDDGNNRIRKIDTAGIISTIVGIGVRGYSSDGTAATLAMIGYPRGIAISDVGEIYFTDSCRIRKINASGTISSIAGVGSDGFGGDGGPATAAELRFPMGMSFDCKKNLYIADWANGRIRKIDTVGIITTIAGSASVGFAGDSGAATAAKLFSPYDVKVGNNGYVYIVEFQNNCARMINNSGIITTIVGKGTVYGYSGDGGPANDARLGTPAGLAFDVLGNLYIADRNYHVIRKIGNLVSASDTICYFTSVEAHSALTGIEISPNPSHGVFTVKVASTVTDNIPLIVTNMVGQKVAEYTISTNTSANLKLDVPSGVYFLTATTANSRWCKKIVVNR